MMMYRIKKKEKTMKTKKEIKLSEIADNPNNPRNIDKPAFEGLKYSMGKFGDISGIVYNQRSKQLIGGHQRKQAILALLKDADILITEEFQSAKEDGTLAYGYVQLADSRFNFRVVDWDDETEKLANITANNVHIQGYYDDIKLGEMLMSISESTYIQPLQIEPLMIEFDLIMPTADEAVVDPTATKEEKPYIKIVFNDVADLKNAQEEIETILTAYPDASLSVSSGAL